MLLIDLLLTAALTSLSITSPSFSFKLYFCKLQQQAGNPIPLAVVMPRSPNPVTMPTPTYPVAQAEEARTSARQRQRDRSRSPTRGAPTDATSARRFHVEDLVEALPDFKDETSPKGKAPATIQPDSRNIKAAQKPAVTGPTSRSLSRNVVLFIIVALLGIALGFALAYYLMAPECDNKPTWKPYEDIYWEQD